MSKFLFYSDIHVYPFNGHSVFLPNGKTNLLIECEESLNWVSEQILEHKPDCVMMLGDLAHTPGYLDSLSINAIVDGMKLIDGACEVVSASHLKLLGNHDLYSEGSNIHSLKFIPDLICKPLVDQKYNCLFLPYTDKPSVYKDLVSSFDGKMICMHLDIKGAYFDNQFMHEYGFDTSWINPNVEIVFGGHYHVPQVVNNRIHIIGSLMYRTYADSLSEMPRGILIYDDSNGNITRIENPKTSLYHTISAKNSNNCTMQFSDFCSRNNDKLDRMYLRVKCDEDVEISKPDNLKFFKFISSKAKEVSTSSNVKHYDDLPLMAYSEWIKNQELNGLNLETIEQIVSNVYNQVSSNNRSSFDLKILSLSGSNFFSFETFDINFSCDPKVTRVEGRNEDSSSASSNGSGKSSIFEALLWLLFGKTIRKVSSSDVVRKQSDGKPVKSGTEVCGVILKGGTKYTIKRYYGHKEHKNALMVFVDNNLENTISPRNLPDSEAHLLDLLGIDYDVFTSVAVLTPETPKFAASTSDTERKQVIEHFANLGIWGLMYTIAKDELSKVSSSVAMHNNSLYKLNVDMKSNEDILRSLNDLKNRYEDEKLSKLNSLNDELVKLDTVLNELYPKVSSIDLNAIETKHAAEKKEIDEEIIGLNNIVIKNDAEIKRLMSERAVAVSTVLSLTNEVKRYKSLIDAGKCTNCGSDIHSSYNRDAIDANESKINDLNLAINSYDNSINDLENEKNIARKSISEANAVLNEKVRKHFELLNVNNSLLNDYNNKYSSRNDLVKNISLLEHSRFSSDHEIGKVETVISGLKEAIKNESDLLSICTNKESHIKFVVNSLSITGLRSDLLARSMEFINHRLLFYSDIATNSDFIVSLDTKTTLKSGKDTTKIDVLINGASNNFRSLSSGEKRRVELMVQFALRDLLANNRGSCNILVLDEISDGLDKVGLSKLVETLEMLNLDIYVITHNQDLASQIYNSIIVAKKDGKSSIVDIN